MIYKKEAELVQNFLKKYAEKLVNECSYDWCLPESWSVYEKEQFVKHFHAWNGTPEEYNPTKLVLPNFAVASFLAYKISKKDSGYSIKVKKSEVNKDWLLGYLTKSQQEDLIKMSENKDGPYVVKIEPSVVGISVKVFDEGNTKLLDLTDYGYW